MTARREVPCNGCRQCCFGEIIFLHPEEGDDPATYNTREVIHPFSGETVLALTQGSNGACSYLGIAGCTIHERAPAICRGFDCKRFYEKMTESFGLREIGMATRHNPVLQMGQQRAKGERP